MTPDSAATQQPKSQAMMPNQPSTEQSNGIITEQMKPADTMSFEPDVNLRGGGAVGDCLAALCAFECCKGICDCCC